MRETESRASQHKHIVHKNDAHTCTCCCCKTSRAVAHSRLTDSTLCVTVPQSMHPPIPLPVGSGPRVERPPHSLFTSSYGSTCLDLLAGRNWRASPPPSASPPRRRTASRTRARRRPPLRRRRGTAPPRAGRGSRSWTCRSSAAAHCTSPCSGAWRSRRRARTPARAAAPERDRCEIDERDIAAEDPVNLKSETALNQRKIR